MFINYSSHHNIFMNIDENNRLSQRFDQRWYSRFAYFPDDMVRNGCANQNKVHSVVFPRLSVMRGYIGAGDSLVRDYIVHVSLPMHSKHKLLKDQGVTTH